MANRVGILIDCSEDIFAEGVRFRSATLGVSAERSDNPDRPYVGLPGHPFCVIPPE